MTHRVAARAQPDAAATFAVGALVRVSKEWSPFYGMTGEVKSLWPDGRSATVRLTSTGWRRTFALADLIVVERGGR